MDDVRVPSTLTLRGTFLGFDKDTWTDENKQRVSRPVLVFATESIRYVQTVRFAKAREEEVREALATAEGRVVSLDVFPGDFKSLVLKSVLEVL